MCSYLQKVVYLLLIIKILKYFYYLLYKYYYFEKYYENFSITPSISKKNYSKECTNVHLEEGLMDALVM